MIRERNRKLCGCCRQMIFNKYFSKLCHNCGVFRVCRQSSHAEEFHLNVLTEPCVTVSRHTALHVNKPHKSITIYGYTNNQCANKLGFSLYLVFKYRTDAFLYKSFSHFTHLSSLAFN